MRCPRCQQVLQDVARFCPNCGEPLSASPAPDPLADTIPATDPLMGRVLDGKYQIIERLGEGSMGIVYRALRLRLRDEVAIKILRPQYASDEAALKRFYREAQSAAQLHHPNIVTIYDIGEEHGEDEPVFIAMELAEGESLGSLLRRTGRMTTERAVALMQDICAGVGAAHRRNIIHRDLKPDNIIVLPAGAERERETAKVVDFGIAKLRSLSNESTLTQNGMLLGTPYYMSPEQCRSERLDARADVYSLGAMLYEMLAGRPPFMAASPVSVISKHLTEAAPPLDPRLGVAPQIEAVVQRALAKHPDLRQLNATFFAGELLEAARAAREYEALLRQQQREAERESARRRRWLIAATLCLLLAGAATFFVVQLAEQRDGGSQPDSASDKNTTARTTKTAPAPANTKQRKTDADSESLNVNGDDLNQNRAALDQKNDQATQYYEQGINYTRSEQYADAVKAYQQAVDLRPDFAAAYAELGYAYNQLNRYDKGRDASKKAISLKPDDAAVYRNLGVSYLGLERWNDAVEAYKQAVRLKPDYARAHNELGFAYRRLHQPWDAIKAFQQAVRYKPDYDRAHYSLGLAYLDVDDRASARDQYEILKGLNQQLADKLYALIYS